jgi:hypothetical protein
MTPDPSRIRWATLARAFDDGPVEIVGTTFISLAAFNYWAYDRFLLSFVLWSQCVGCDAPARPLTALELLAVGVVPASYLASLLVVRSVLLRSVWGLGTLLLALLTTARLAASHEGAVRGAGERWAAVNEPARLAVAFGGILVASALLVVVRELRRRETLGALPSVVSMSGAALLVYGLNAWSRASVSSPMAKAAQLAEGTQDIVTWWKVSFVVLSTVGTLGAVRAWRLRKGLRRTSWLWLAAGVGALALTLPHAQDAWHPPPLREAVPPGLTQVDSCLASRIPESVPLELGDSAIASALPAGPGVGYLPASMQRSVKDMGPLLQAALTRGLLLIVVPAKRPRWLPTQTLGQLGYDEVCLGGQFRLSTATGARPLAEFSTLGDLVSASSPIDPTVPR